MHRTTRRQTLALIALGLAAALAPSQTEAGAKPYRYTGSQPPPRGSFAAPQRVDGRWYFGVSGYSVRANCGRYSRGLCISNCFHHSPAYGVGLCCGDVIVQAGGFLVRHQSDLSRAVSRSGGLLDLVVLSHRTGRLFRVRVPLAACGSYYRYPQFRR